MMLPLNMRSSYNRLEGFSAGTWRLLLRGGRETTGEGGSDGMCEAVRKGGILLLPLKLLSIAGPSPSPAELQLAQAHTLSLAHTHRRSHK